MNLKKSFVVVWGLLYLICAVASPNMIENVGAFALPYFSRLWEV